VNVQLPSQLGSAAVGTPLQSGVSGTPAFQPTPWETETLVFLKVTDSPESMVGLLLVQADMELVPSTGGAAATAALEKTIAATIPSRAAIRA
jgi:hypothetical protein